jgi:hypothetical protein
VRRTLYYVDVVVKLVFAAAMLGGGIALMVGVAGIPAPEPHHGDAMDAWDGIGQFFELVGGAGAIVLLVIGGFVLRSAVRTIKQGPPAPPPPPGTDLPTARVHGAPPAPR